MAPGSEVKVGTYISVFWDLDRRWYSAEVVDYDCATGIFKVLYTDGEREEFTLTEVKHRIMRGGKSRARAKVGDGGVSSKKQIEYIVQTLKDIEDRLPPKGVFNNRKRWWFLWHSRVSKAAKTGDVADLVRAAVEIAFQMRDNISTSWWKSQRSEWQNQVEGSRTYGVLASRLSELLTKAVNWPVARQLFSSDFAESENPGSPAVEVPKKNIVGGSGRHVVNTDCSGGGEKNTSSSEKRQQRMRDTRSGRRVSEDDGSKKLISCPAHPVRRSKRKLIAANYEELSLSESPAGEAPAVDLPIPEDLPSSVKRRKQGKRDEGNFLDPNQKTGKKSCSGATTQEDQSPVCASRLKRYGRKGHSSQSVEGDHRREDPQQTEMNSKTQVGYFRAKRYKPRLELDQIEAGQKSEMEVSELGRKVTPVRTEDIVELEEGLEAAKCPKSSCAENSGQRNGSEIAQNGPLQLEQESVVQIKRKRGRPRKIKRLGRTEGVEFGNQEHGTGNGKYWSSNKFGGLRSSKRSGLQVSSSQPETPVARVETELEKTPALADENFLTADSIVQETSAARVATELQKTPALADENFLTADFIVQVNRKRGRPKKRRPANGFGVKSDKKQTGLRQDSRGTSGQVKQINSLEDAEAGNSRQREDMVKRKIGRQKKSSSAKLLDDIGAQKVDGNICAAEQKSCEYSEGMAYRRGPHGVGPGMSDSSAEVEQNRQRPLPRKGSELPPKEKRGQNTDSNASVGGECPSCSLKHVNEHHSGNMAEDTSVQFENESVRGEPIKELPVTKMTNVAGAYPGLKEHTETSVQVANEVDPGGLKDNSGDKTHASGEECSEEECPTWTRRRHKSLGQKTTKNHELMSKVERMGMSSRRLQVPNEHRTEETSFGDLQDESNVMHKLPGVLSAPLKEAVSCQSRMQTGRDVIGEPRVGDGCTKSGTKNAPKEVNIPQTRSCAANSEESTSGHSSDIDDQEYQAKENRDSLQFMDPQNSWGERLPSDISDFEDEVLSSQKTSQTHLGQVEVGHEQPLTVHNLSTGEEICSICDFAGADELMLLCDEAGCTCASHIFCLDPPLKEIPEGEWLCPHCTHEKANLTYSKRQTKKCSGAKYPRNLVSSIIGRRVEPLPEEGTTSGKTKIQYLVKWECLSHEHDTWVPEDWLLFMDSRLLMGFQRKHPLSSEAANLYVDEQKPEWLMVDRVISCRRQHGKLSIHPSQVSKLLQAREQDKTRLEFLVKWQALEHTSATWERRSDSEEMQKALSDFTKRHERGEESSAREEKVKPVAAIKQQPDYLRGGMMYGFQLHGLKWLLSNFEQGRSVILADEMGLGKTVQSLAFISCVRYERLSSRPVLVIAPKSTLPGWEQEFRRWVPDLNVVVYQGDKENRALIREHEFYTANKKPLFEVLLTSYELATFDDCLLNKFHWASIVVDEGHRVKNMRSKLSTLLKRHNADFRLLLTGTPVQNTLTELFALLHFLDPMEFPDPEFSAQQFTDVDVHSNNTDAKVIEQQVSRLHELLNPRMLRRLKSEVLSDMIPAKKLVEISCALTPLQRHLYIHVLKRNFKVLNKGVRSGMKRSLHTVLTDLKMVCNHPLSNEKVYHHHVLSMYLFPGKDPELAHSNPGEAHKLLVAASGKLQLLEKLLPLLKEGGHRVLLFSQMTKMLDILEDFMGFLGLSYSRIDGSTSASDRQKNIAEFNAEDSSTFIFLISTRAGGLGINLPTADTVIIYDPDFNPFVDLQAQARAHRIGQEKTVLVYQLITKCSVEEKILQRSRKKLAMETLVMSTESQGTAADIDTLLRHGAREVLHGHNMEAFSVKFTDESVKKLLDRTLSTSVNDDEAQTHGYLGAVQGAGIRSSTVDEQEEPDSKGVDGTAWQELLQNFVEQDVKEELGRGKRVRKQVLHAIEGEVEGEEDDEYDPTSDSESSSSVELSLDLDGFNMNEGSQAVGPASGDVPVCDFPGMPRMACTPSVPSGLVLPGASVPVSPLPPSPPPLASILAAGSIFPPSMGPAASTMFPGMSAGATSSGAVGNPPALAVTSGGPSSSEAVGFMSNVLFPGTSGGDAPSHLGSMCTNLRGPGESGHMPPAAVGLHSSTLFPGAGPSGTHSQNSLWPPTAIYPYTNMGSPMASPFHAIPCPPYFPYYAPPFPGQPMASNPDERVDSANANTMSHPAFAFSNLQQAVQGWRTSYTGRMNYPAVPGFAGSGGGCSRASGHPDPVGGDQLPETSPSQLQPTPSAVQSGVVGSRQSISKPARRKRVSRSRLSTFPVAPWLTGYCNVPSMPHPCQIEPNMMGAPLAIPPVTASAAPAMSGIPPGPPMCPAFAFQNPMVPPFQQVFTNFDYATHLSGVPQTLWNPNSGISMLRSCPPSTPNFVPPMDDKASSSVVSPAEAPRVFSPSTLPSHQGAEDSRSPHRRKKCSRKSHPSRLPTLQSPQQPPMIGRNPPGGSPVDRIFIDGESSSSGNHSSACHSQPASVSFGERVGNDVESRGIPEQKHDHSSSLPSASKPLQTRKPMWAPKGDAGLLMGHLPEHKRP